MSTAEDGMSEISDERLDEILRRLIREGFGLPFGARVRDYMPEDRVYDSDSPELAALREADAEADRMNMEALRRALTP